MFLLGLSLGLAIGALWYQVGTHVIIWAQDRYIDLTQ